MNLKTKSLLLNVLVFIPIYLIFRFLLTYLAVPYIITFILSGILTIFLAPKFTVVNGMKGEKLFMKWIFKKGVTEIK
ncbi:hypothetical protein [Robertkochia solimangrovi]|uniref:hypothetical protein n=1 Tax=Robertkochia solimangrovi TaxID=2213046 RepID=UPI00117F3EE1|nr:hypothetical protein [Robertkochia solimangrovi]